jgi:hypothetical protein
MGLVMRLAYLTEPGATLSFAGKKTLFRHDAAAKPSTPTISMRSFANCGRRTERAMFAMSGQYAGVAPFRGAGHCSNCGRQF